MNPPHETATERRAAPESPADLWNELASGQFGLALSRALREREEAESRGDVREMALAELRAVQARLVSGDDDDVDAQLVRAMERATAEAWRAILGRAFVLRAEQELHRRDPARALVYVEKAIESLRDGDDRPTWAWGCLVGALAASEIEDGGEAILYVEQMRSSGGAAGLGPFSRLAELVEARCADRRGDAAAAQELLARLAGSIRSAGAHELVWRARWELARVTRGREGLEAALPLYDRAREAMEQVAESLPPEAASRYRQTEPRASLLREIEGLDPRTESATVRSIHEIVRSMNSIWEIGRLLDSLLDALLQLCGAERARISIRDAELKVYETARCRSRRPPRREEAGFSRTLMDRVLAEGRPWISRDVRADPRLQDSPSVRKLDLRSVLCLPLRIRTRGIGVMALESSADADEFDDRRIRIAEILTDHAAVAIEGAMLRERALRDPLTELSTHTHFQSRLDEELARARRHNRSLGLLLVDLDRFKLVNDVHGHLVGNEILRAVAARLRSAVRSYDLIGRCATVARFGGDEFEVLLPDVGRDALAVAAERIVEEFRRRPVRTEAVEIPLTVSVGGAVFPDDAPDSARLLARADEAMYQAKEGGRNGWRVGSPDSPAPAAPSPVRELEALLLSREGASVLTMVTKLIEESNDPERMLRSGLELLARSLQGERGFVVTVGADGSPTCVARFGSDGERVPVDAPQISSGVVRRAIQERRSVLIPRVSCDDWAAERPSIRGMGVTSVLAVPICLEAEVLAVLYVDTASLDHPFGPEGQRLAEALARRLARPLKTLQDLEQQRGRIARLEWTLRHGLRELRQTYSYGALVGRSKPMREVFELLQRIEGSDLPVLIQGETGVGKELVAKAIHFNSPRRERPFLPINCAAIPETLLESELFGHAKGAFTGAHEDKPGFFELAEGGTILLDEVEEMSPAMQAKLLRVLEEGEFRPVGARASRRADVRMLAATNRDLRGLAREGKFREDLLYRLRVFFVEIPPLRERVEDIPLLVDRFLQEAATAAGRSKPRVQTAALDAIITYPWPGNGRELRNELMRVCHLAGEEVPVHHLSPFLRSHREITSATQGASLSERLAMIETELITRALREQGWHQRRTAEALGMDDSTLNRRIRQLGIVIPR